MAVPLRGCSILKIRIMMLKIDRRRTKKEKERSEYFYEMRQNNKLDNKKSLNRATKND